jgi:hypothetical protein
MTGWKMRKGVNVEGFMYTADLYFSVKEAERQIT